MNIRRIDNSDLDLIESLWNDLKSHHQAHTRYFEDYYKQNNFAKRKVTLLSKDQLAVFVVVDDKRFIAFCIASINKGQGEVESLFVRPAFRGQYIGDSLMQSAVNWLREHKVTPIRLLVGEGNESALGFYERLGFKPRAVMMELL